MKFVRNDIITDNEPPIYQEPDRGCKRGVCSYIPIDPPGTFLRLDVNVIMVDLQFGDFHLEEVGLELDCPAHGAKVWP